MMAKERMQELAALYRKGLLEDTLPFWVKHCVDREHGGFLFCLDRDGTVVDTDKGMWTQGRFTWLLGTLYSEVEPRALERLHVLAVGGAALQPAFRGDLDQDRGDLEQGVGGRQEAAGLDVHDHRQEAPESIADACRAGHVGSPRPSSRQATVLPARKGTISSPA